MIRRARPYDLADYTDQGVLRVSRGTWLAMLFLCRQLGLIVVVAVSSMAARRRGLDLTGLGLLAGDPVLILASVPALAVVVAASRRVPVAGRIARAVWARGRWLLMLSALLDLLLTYLRLPVRLSQLSLAYLAAPLVDCYLLVYLAGSRRVIDTFAEFPPVEQG